MSEFFQKIISQAPNKFLFTQNVICHFVLLDSVFIAILFQFVTYSKCRMFYSDFLYMRNPFRFFRKISYVPAHEPVTKCDIDKLKEFLLKNKNNIVALTGAGISTESGIPDYRSEDVGLYARTNHKPMTYQKFMENDSGRRRYWARSYVGWPDYSKIAPNSVHNALRKLEDEKIISTIITQNVDNLHFKAGSRNVIELHGSLYRVMCISCQNYTIDRYEFQRMLENLNPKFQVTPQMVRPDGDVDLPEDYVQTFKIPNCPKCNGYLKPDVTFFGENVPMRRVKQVRQEINNCSSLLVLGSSITVFSAYRILLQAKDLEKPIGIVNIGPTRGDDLACLKIHAKCGDILKSVLISIF